MRSLTAFNTDSHMDLKCLFFVDDSNVWIEAKKFAASGNAYMPKLADGDRDIRLRVNIGRLVTTLCNGRSMCQWYIYGARPPPNDLAWAQYDRQREGVDSSMSVDLTEEATALRTTAKYNPDVKKQNEKTLFVIVTGNRDMLPAVKKVLGCGIRVEIWGWISGMPKEYLRERNGNDLLTIKFLDDIFNKISFTVYRSTHTTRIDVNRAIVFYQSQSGLVREKTWDDAFVAKRLLQLGCIFYTTRSKKRPEIIAGFPDVDNVESVIFRAKKLFSEDISVSSWANYISRFNKHLPDVVETVDIFRPVANKDEDSSPQVPKTYH